MKNKIRLLGTFALAAVMAISLTLTTGGCGSSPSTPANTAQRTGAANIDELDIAIRDASDYLNKNIPKGSKIVILNIS